MGNEVSITINADGTAAVKGMKNIESQTSQSTLNIRDAWLKVGAVIASTAWLQSAAKDALEAEQAQTKLRFQVEALGISFSNASMAVDEAIQKSSEYARVQDDEVVKTLQTLIFNSGKYKESLENLNLAYDLAYQKGISVEESAALLGKAMTGNVDMLGRYIPELRYLEQTLGKNATETQKSTYALLVLKEKAEGAMKAMGEHEKQIREVAKAYEDLKQVSGQVALAVASAVVNVVVGLGAMINHAMGMVVGAVAKFYELLGKMPGSIGEPYRKAAESVRALSQHFFDASKIGEEFAKRFRAMSDVMDKQTDATNRTTGAHQQYAESIKKENDELLAAEERQKQYLERQKELVQETRALIEETEKHNAAISAQGAQRLLDMMANPPEMALPEQFSETEQEMNKLKETDAYWRERISLMEQYGYTETAINQAKNDALLAHDRQTSQLRLAAAANTMGMVANMMQNLYVATGSKHKELFEVMKVFAIGETIINTIKNAEAGASALAGIPIIGPALATAYKVASYAAGAAAVSNIMSTKPGGATASISAGGSASPSYSGGAPSAYPVPERLEKAEQYQPKNITIIVQGNIVDQAAFARELAPYIDEAKGDKVSYGN